jgi:hypothetical protein
MSWDPRVGPKPLNLKALLFFETSGHTNPPTELHIPEDVLNFNQKLEIKNKFQELEVDGLRIIQSAEKTRVSR